MVLSDSCIGKTYYFLCTDFSLNDTLEEEQLLSQSVKKNLQIFSPDESDFPDGPFHTPKPVETNVKLFTKINTLARKPVETSSVNDFSKKKEFERIKFKPSPASCSVLKLLKL